MSKRMMKEQKHWSKPQLIILGRGKAEENVLAGCKGGIYSGPYSQHSLCNNPRNGCSSVICKNLAPS